MTIQIIKQKNGELREMLCPDKRDSFSKENRFRIVAALDNIGDTALGMRHYEEKGIGQELEEKYIKIFGLLQSIYLQQDSIRELYKLIIGSWDKPDESSAWKYLRDVRNCVAGYPAERGGAISRMTLSDDGFKIGYWDKSSVDNFPFEYVPLKERYEEYIQEVDVMLERLKKAVG
ncbi:MAG: hypothetical protein GY749_06020 [Desulfobacteraceae bacterium]|nr:hypothetical protein [Desulfobacteraceae bacterium]